MHATITVNDLSEILQEELGLPLVFTRGFVQELKVFLPLRNLLREQVLMNTTAFNA
jgi:hypothetical protein